MRAPGLKLFIVMVIVVVVLIFGANFLAQVVYDEEETREKTAPSLQVDDYGITEEIGWRPMIGNVQEEPMSGVWYVVISINGDTKDTLTYRQCFVNFHAGSPLAAEDEALNWRDNSKTKQREVYVISKDFPSLPTYLPVLFAMKNARILRPGH